MVGHLQNIFMEHNPYCDFWHKRKINNFDPYNVFLAVATHATYGWFCGPVSRFILFQLYLY